MKHGRPTARLFRGPHRLALRGIAREACARTDLSRSRAYMLRSLVGDLRVARTVDGSKCDHAPLAERHL